MLRASSFLVDIMPTVLALSGFELELQGYAGFVHNDIPVDRSIYSHCFRGKHCASIIKNGKRYIHHFHKRPDELYDLLSDPEERSNIIKSQPEMAERLLNELLDWRLGVIRYYDNFYKLGR